MCFSTGCRNISIGRLAGRGGSSTVGDNGGKCNISIGDCAGSKITSGETNVMIGQNITYNVSGGAFTGSRNVFLGFCAANQTCTGSVSNSVYVGSYAGARASGGYNTFFGAYSGAKFNCGKCNVAIGARALCGQSSNSTGCCNIAIGICAARS